MTFSLLPHVALRLNQVQPEDEASALNRYALIDCGQIRPTPKTFEHWLQHNEHVRLFSGTFADAANELSPVLVLLRRDGAEAQRQLEALDPRYSQLPVVAMIESTWNLQALAKHLQRLLKLKAGDRHYLLRLADTQMLMAAVSVMRPDQLSAFFLGVAHWWAVDHAGTCRDLAQAGLQQEAAELPLVLSEEQTAELLQAAQLPMAIKQLEWHAPSFRALPYVEQMHFMSACNDTLSDEDRRDEIALLSTAMRCWRARGQ